MTEVSVTAGIPTDADGKPVPERCLGCLHQRKEVGAYLCGVCWGRLPREVRDALYRKDRLAAQRLLELYAEIDRIRSDLIDPYDFDLTRRTIDLSQVRVTP